MRTIMEHDQDFKKFIETVRRTALTDSEKAAMRSALLSHIERTPLSEKKSPYVVRSPYRFSFSIREIVFVRPLATVLIAVFVLLSTGTAAALGAESTLPGDFLYPVKIKVTEPLVRILRVADPIQERVSYEWALVEKRLEEAERLAFERRLEQQAGKIKTAISMQRLKALEAARAQLPEEETTVVATLSAPAETRKISKASTPRETSGVANRSTPAQPVLRGVQNLDAPPEYTRETDTNAQSIAEENRREHVVLSAPSVSKEMEEVKYERTERGPTYQDAVRKMEQLFEKHRDIVQKLGLERSAIERSEKPNKAHGNQ